MSEFLQVLFKVQDLHKSKSKDYGTNREPFQNVIDGATFAGIEPWVAAMVRANDKMGRLSKTAQGGTQEHDSALDDFLDIATYAIIGYCLYNRNERGAIEELTEELQAWSKVAMGWPIPVSDD